MRRVLAAALAGWLLVACGSGGTTSGATNGGSNNGNNNNNNNNNGGGGGNNNGGEPLPDGATVEGYVFRASRQIAVGQTPLANAELRAFALPATDLAVGVTRTTTRGRYLFSPGLRNPLPRQKTVLLSATDGQRIASGLFNTGQDGGMRNLNEITHIAALAALEGTPDSVDDATITQLETAARAALDEALSGDPAADFCAVGNQEAAAQLAHQVAAAVAAGGTSSNRPPTALDFTLNPSQLAYTGGEVTLSAHVTDPDGDPLAVSALVYGAAGEAPTVIDLMPVEDRFEGTLAAEPNDTDEARLSDIALVVDDGVTAPVPASVQTLVVLRQPRLTLDILTETLFDEEASRGRLSLAAVLDRMRPVVRRGGVGRARQVNPNQSIRGASVQLDDLTSALGMTGDDGLLLLEVPTSVLDDGLLSMTATISGRVAYRQFLVLPEGLEVQDGDIVQVDLVLAHQQDWQTLADDGALQLGHLDYAKSPLSVFFNVINTLSLGAAQPGATRFRPLDSSEREDDGDFFAANLAPGPITITGVFADPEDSAVSPPFGPLTLPFKPGQVNAVSLLLPPSP